MDVNVADGSVNFFVHLGNTVEDATATTYEIGSAVYFEVREYRDYSPSIAMAFLKDDKLQLLELHPVYPDHPYTVWHF